MKHKPLPVSELYKLDVISSIYKELNSTLDQLSHVIGNHMNVYG